MVKCMSTSSTKKEESVVDIIKEFGALPFAGFASAILVGKELFMVNEEVLVLGIFSGVIFYGYVTLYDSVNQDFVDYASDIKKEQVEAREYAIAKLNDLADEHRKMLNVSAEVESMYQHYEKTRTAWCGAINNKMEQDYINQLEAHLQDLHEVKGYVEEHNTNKILTTAAANLNTYLSEKLPQTEKDAYFKWAMGQLEASVDPTKSDSDPDFITAQFQKELEAVVKKVNGQDVEKTYKDIMAKIESGEIDGDAPAMKIARKLVS
eukprot:CAMPEP_0197524926 /NCGR_PEP_ID=MMETSP1318-20131121/10371_1 /TAXON_ID=552666 /ORGANISM="Partenskyella glossopodia, Strain RCC365" /LENGTH=263 /DNA_ID=CAMNT_0043078027 /DNA_START=84 /DNA_END=875 /DNA_ORIENTATION=+